MRTIIVFSIVVIGEVLGRASREAEKKQDTVACGELREEYVRVCTGANTKRREQKDKDFCNAFENICFSIPEGEPDKVKDLETTESPRTFAISPTSAASAEQPHKKKNFARFCREFKNRYLYVCPDPFRFGQKAIVFCPVYSEKCQVPLPDKPVVPQRKSSRRRGGGAVNQLCRSYQGFAMNYCNNPILTAQSQYRAACDKYWRYCGKFHQQG
uniref:BPTI/Kunitz inhibitor domain-containing protein n=1 Tax=Caenorhabditis tropicalis TaxID=1561998 RepID=A0A1I7TG31_9PELO